METKPKKDLIKGHLGKDKKLKSKIIETSKLQKEFVKSLKSNDILLKESSGYLEAEEGEDLLRLRQKDLKPLLPVANVNQIFDLDLDFGYYNIDFTRSGKYVLLAGSKGHVAMMDWKEKKLKCEFNVQDKIRDIKFLHNETLYAVAQEKYLYIYDNNGTEVHRLKSHPEPLHLEFLPYHFLLSTMTKEGLLLYQDVSTGKQVAEHKTKIKEAGCTALNPYNGMVLVGDPRGQVTMWCPNAGVPIVKMLCHKGAINSIAVDNPGRHLVTAGTDGKMKVWDVRTYKEIFEYWNPTPAQKLTISQKGLLCVGLANEVQIWKDWFSEKQKKPYLRQGTYKGKLLNDVQFVPYEDFLGIGLKDGFSSIVIPGAGEANFDTFEVNPFQTKKQRNQQEVVQLLDKLPPESITLDPTIIGTIDKASRDVIQAEKKVEEDEEERKRSQNRKKREKTRGRSSTKEKYVQKESVHDQKTRDRIREIMNNRLKLRKIEKQKLLHERQTIQDDELFDNFDPVVALKKQKH